VRPEAEPRALSGLKEGRMAKTDGVGDPRPKAWGSEVSIAG